MARTLALRMTARILDEQNIQAIATAYALIDPTATFDDITAIFDEWLADLDALTDGQIIGAWYFVTPALPGGLKGTPAAGSRVEQTGLINFSATGTARRWAEAIPALSNGSTVIGGGRIVLTSGDPAATLIALLTTGTTNLEFTNDAQQPLVALKDTLISFREYHRQLAAATYET